MQYYKRTNVAVLPEIKHELKGLLTSLTLSAFTNSQVKNYFTHKKALLKALFFTTNN